MTEVILVIYFNSNPALMPLQKRAFQLSKIPKIRDFNVDFLKKIPGCIAHRPIQWGEATVPLPRPHHEGAPRL